MNNISLLKILLTCYFIENILPRNKSSYITPFREVVRHTVPKAVSEFSVEGHQTNPRETLSASPERRSYSLVEYMRPFLGITIHYTSLWYYCSFGQCWKSLCTNCSFAFRFYSKEDEVRITVYKNALSEEYRIYEY
jgi:hypothetical protein